MVKKMLKRKGFTLIELMIVIAVIALLILVLVPRIGIIKNKAREAGLRSNMLMLEAEIQSVIDDYTAVDADIDALEIRIDADVDAAAVTNQKFRNPVTGNLGADVLANVATSAVSHADTDDANNGTGIAAVYTPTLVGAAGNIAYCAYIDTAYTPSRISVRLIPYGVNNARITALEKVVTQ